MTLRMVTSQRFAFKNVCSTITCLFLFHLLLSSAGESEPVRYNETTKQISRQCAPGCEERGNCDQETGRCTCPWGLEGVACERDRMAACRQTPTDPGSCGNTFPKNCECYRACYRLYCPDASPNTDLEEECTHGIGRCLWRAHCFVYGSQSPHGVNDSAYPEDLNQTKWYVHIPELVGSDTYDASLLAPEEYVGTSGVWENPVRPLPLSACSHRCSGVGICVQPSPSSYMASQERSQSSWEDVQAGKALCWCRPGYKGESCQDVNPETCWFAPGCGSAGICKSGFCHCQPGRWGLGCARTRAFAPTEMASTAAAAAGTLPDQRRPGRLRVYLYDLPWQVAFPYEFNDADTYRDPNYTAYEWFLQYFLADNVVRTENPYEANLFYVPLLAYWYAANIGPIGAHASVVLSYVQQTWPFYNRSGGRDHFFFLSGDRGACKLPFWLHAATMKVVHFGLQAPILRDGHPTYGCVRISRDVVVPPYQRIEDASTGKLYRWLNATGGKDGNRTTLLFFAGSLRAEDPEYSGGARQAVAHMLHTMKDAPPGVVFVDGSVPDYAGQYRMSDFCLAPYGYGYGMRLSEAITHGCIPIIVQDYVYQPFEEFLPYEEFSIRLPKNDIPHLLELLASYTAQDKERLRLGLARWYRAFVWDRREGGQAFEWTLRALERRAYNLKAGMFRRRRGLR